MSATDDNINNDHRQGVPIQETFDSSMAEMPSPPQKIQGVPEPGIHQGSLGASPMASMPLPPPTEEIEKGLGSSGMTTTPAEQTPPIPPAQEETANDSD